MLHIYIFFIKGVLLREDHWTIFYILLCSHLAYHCGDDDYAMMFLFAFSMTLQSLYLMHKVTQK